MTSDPLAAPEPASAAAVLKTGIMGSAMARHLVTAGRRQRRALALGRSARAGG